MSFSLLLSALNCAAWSLLEHAMNKNKFSLIDYLAYMHCPLYCTLRHTAAQIIIKYLIGENDARFFVDRECLIFYRLIYVS